MTGPGDELKQLADTFDAMLDRLQASFEGQRRFVADASHELRTPLAVMRTEVDVALADPDASVGELRAAAEVVREATMRADRLVDSLLLLARSDRLSPEALPSRERVELPVLCDEALRAVAGEVAGRRLRVATSYAPAGVLGDRGLLGRLAGNLVENAVRHNVDGGWVRVDTGTVAGRARLQVEQLRGGAAGGGGARAVRAVPPARHRPDRPARRRSGAVDRAGRRGGARRHGDRRAGARRRPGRHGGPAAQPLTAVTRGG